MIKEAAEQFSWFNYLEMHLRASRAAQRMLNLRYVSRHAAKEAMFICWKKFEKIPLTHDYVYAFEPAASLEEVILADCVRGWLPVGLNDEDLLLMTARRIVNGNHPWIL